jgi:hypothetical protein
MVCERDAYVLHDHPREPHRPLPLLICAPWRHPQCAPSFALLLPMLKATSLMACMDRFQMHCMASRWLAALLPTCVRIRNIMQRFCAATSRYNPNTPYYDSSQRHGKNGGYQIAETTYRSTRFGAFRTLQDLRSFPGFHQLESRVPFPGAHIICCRLPGIGHWACMHARYGSKKKPVLCSFVSNSFGFFRIFLVSVSKRTMLKTGQDHMPSSVCVAHQCSGFPTGWVTFVWFVCRVSTRRRQCQARRHRRVI